MTQDYINDLKKQTLKWKTTFSVNSPIASTGTIAYYSIYDDAARGNIIMIPGMASNCDTEPLMQSITDWGLHHQYNIFYLDTFLGNLKSAVSADDAARNTVPELISSVDLGLTKILERAPKIPTQIMAHSVGAVTTLNVINNRIRDGRPTNFSKIILFAPFISNSRFERIKKIYKRNKTEEEFAATPIRVDSMCLPQKQPHCISVYPEFFEQIHNLNLPADIIAKNKMPTTIVAGGRDSKVSSDVLYDLYKKLASESTNPQLYRYILYPRCNHSFAQNDETMNKMLNQVNSTYRHTPHIR